MRRYHILRFDIWLCLLFSVLLATGASKIATKILENKYETYTEEHKVDANEIGGKAGEDVFRAESVEDLLSHDTFTIVSPGIEYRNKGAGYYKGMYLYAVTLPSGEKVAARVNSDGVTHEGESIYSGNSILPVGRIVKADLSSEQTFLNQIEHSEKLDRKDFYIDMVGEAEVIPAEYYVEGTALLIQLLVVAITFPIFHSIGSKIGIFPYIFPPKEKIKKEA
ncbi:MAG: hypothetical protein K2H20_03505 [Bacilli bacterium]|nr:hypothetical protein [Bacilli bacterium]